jgi:hypothetical protein
MAPASKAPDTPHRTCFAARILSGVFALPGNLTFQRFEAVRASPRIKLRAGT